MIGVEKYKSNSCIYSFNDGAEENPNRDRIISRLHHRLMCVLVYLVYSLMFVTGYFSEVSFSIH